MAKDKIPALTDGWLVRTAKTIERTYRSWRSPPAETYQNLFVGNEEPHLQRFAEKFFERGRRLRRLATLLLFAAIGLVIVGVVAFLFPTRVSDAGTDEVDKRLAELKQQLQELSAQETDVEQAFESGKHVQAGLAPFKELDGFLNAIDTAEFVNQQRGNPIDLRLVDATHVLDAVEDRSTPYVLDLSDYTYLGRAIRASKPAISRKSLGELAVTIDRSGVNRQALRNGLNDLANSIGSGTVVDDARFGSVKDNLKKLGEVFDRKVDEVNELDNKLGLLGQEATDRQLRRQSLEQEIAQVVAIRELRRGDSIDLRNWIPVLSVRIGVVILLLFLVRILLATYRYSTSLAAFFTARGDALQLLGERNGVALIDRVQYGELVKILAPDQLRVESVEAPDQILAETARGAGK